jgi:hypothetical protein
MGSQASSTVATTGTVIMPVVFPVSRLVMGCLRTDELRNG